MKIQEVSEYCHMSKRAIKYYEEKGLLKIKKDNHGYRCYQKEDLKRLQEIACYRKLDIDIPTISKLLAHPEEKQTYLRSFYQKKLLEVSQQQKQLKYLKQLTEDPSIVVQLNDTFDYSNIAQAIKDMVPGIYGDFFFHHFLPYLQISLQSEDQKDAYQKILAFCDQTNIKIPLVYRLISFIHRFMPTTSQQQTQQIDDKIQNLLYLSEEEYEDYKAKIIQQVKHSQRFLYQYHPLTIAKRNLMKQLQNCGYNDIFIPCMLRLSPKYKQYHEALLALNERIYQDTGLHYDTNFRLKI